MARFVINCINLRGCGTSRPNQPLFTHSILLSGFICCGEKLM
jgi:hypothetical protein